MNITKKASSKIAMIGLAAMLSIAPITFSSASSTAAAASSSNSKSSIKLLFNGQEYSPSSAPLFYKDSVYLPLRDIGELLGSVVFWNAQDQSVTMTYPNRIVSMKLNASIATVNGTTVKLNSPVIVRSGRTFVPIRFFSEAIGAGVEWNAAKKTVSLSQKSPYVQGAGVNTSIWLNKNTGDLYFAYPFEAKPEHVGQLNVDIQEFTTISAYSMPSAQQSYIITVEDNYGEPHVHTNVYTAFIKDKQVISQSKAYYFQRYEKNAVVDQDGNAVLTDGKLLSIIDADGQVIREYDLPKLTGKDENHSVLAVSSSYLLIRPNLSGHLTLINLKDNSATLLYQQFLSGEELEYAEMNDVPYHGDNLVFLGETGDGSLQFENRSLYDNHSKKYVFKLK
ncbi:copper amine oxidase N-terminal domain-containing protein [Paenibacillus sp. FSL W8-0186]|uniref:Copper amine oxidase-like N-terminal domain-containing protein n=1 Tax=Paenibacillus woosongensis TaxID=307580 RepID=A0ABQ4MK18_9BACL|nr:copper amine oxidase N-terminal domain-containing protein [Paenibacillus woosongensis]GIP56329.1 hypothetical protein J15TS10_01430 [Paenibacillus woosongensis]